MSEPLRQGSAASSGIRRCVVLGGLFALGCGGGVRSPFEVQRPLVVTPDEPFRAQAPSVTGTLTPNVPRVESRRLGNGFTVVVVRTASSAPSAIVYANRAARYAADYLTTFVGDALLAGTTLPNGEIRHPSFGGYAPAVGTSLIGTTVGGLVVERETEADIWALAQVVRRPAFEPIALRSLQTLAADDLRSMTGAWHWMLAGQTQLVRNGGEQLQLDRVMAADERVLADYHRRYYQPADSALIVVGDVEPDEAFAASDRSFGDWALLPETTAESAPTTRSEDAAEATCEPPATRTQPEIYLLAGESQPFLTLTQCAPGPYDPDRIAFELALDTLAGAATSRVMSDLRFAQGLSYSVSTNIEEFSSHASSSFLSVTIRSGEFSSGLERTLEALRRIAAEGISAQELTRAKARWLRFATLALSTNSGVAHELGRAFFLGSSLDARPSAKLVQRVTLADVQRVAARYLNAKTVTIGVTGQLTDEERSRVHELGKVNML